MRKKLGGGGMGGQDGGPQVLREPWEVRFNEARVTPPKIPGSQAAGGLWR